MVTIKNIHTGAETPMTKKEWNKVKEMPEYKGIFELVDEQEPAPEAPPEVKELEIKKANTRAKKVETPGTETQAE